MRTSPSLIRKALGLALSIESPDAPEAAAAITAVELEHTWYGQLADRSQLDGAATVEKQEQWSVPAKPGDDCRYGGSIRVRKSQLVRGDVTENAKYMLCIKAFEKGKQGCLENEFVVNEATFEQFKKISASGMIKTRYSFPIEGSEFAFEVDVYQNDANWVKVDLEVDDPKFEVPSMPVELKGLFKDNPSNRTPAQEKFIEELMTRYFRCNNPYTIEK